MATPHVLVIPYPAQGHVIPMMELSQRFIEHGFKVTFVNSDFNHERVVNAFTKESGVEGGRIRLVSIPDGMGIDEDRNEIGKLTEAFLRVMPGKLEEVIGEIDGSGGDEITCVVADMNMGWALEVAAKLGIKRAAFWPAAVSLLALGFSIPKLMADGIIDHEGTPLKRHEMVQLSPNMPLMNPSNFVWASIGDLAAQKIILDLMIRNNKVVELADWLICNSTHNMEPAAFALAPQALPIGPLSTTHRLGAFWPEDSTCLKWLDQQPARSVIYVAFGSFTVFDETQFRELALGLELSNRPFLWVVRPDMSQAYAEGFLERVGSRGRMVGWAPQGEVLSHVSVACFVSHCGWNSTVEGMSNGVPFLCWPYFADQFLNETYVCDVWKVGLSLERDESGIIRREEIKDKVEKLLDDEDLKGRVLDMMEMASSETEENGCSYKNMNNFIEWIKA